jgi:hypothetical protein
MINADCRRVVMLAVCLAAGGCLVTPESVAVHRASREFGCPSEKVAVVQRADISESLYDVAACGQRARYSCIYTDLVQPDTYMSMSQCVREPDPPKWDPDPTMIASLPGPAFATSEARNNLRRICGDYEYGDCLYRDHGSWRWREAHTGGCGYGMMSCP